MLEPFGHVLARLKLLVIFLRRQGAPWRASTLTPPPPAPRSSAAATSAPDRPVDSGTWEKRRNVELTYLWASIDRSRPGSMNIR
jgi:hypothetical protein